MDVEIKRFLKDIRLLDKGELDFTFEEYVRQTPKTLNLLG